MTTYFDLNRRFVALAKYDPDELIVAEVTGKRRVDWTEVLAHPVSVVVAPANFGKTTEMQQRARQMRAASEPAIFIALRRMADRSTLEKALEPEELSAYLAWKASPSGRLTVFVDSLDEAAAGKKEGIEYLISDVASALTWPNDRVRWVISTRPAVLTDEVLEKVAQILATSAVSATSTIPPAPTPQSAGASTTTSSVPAATAKLDGLRLFRMAPLDLKQAEAYLAGKYPGLSNATLLKIARERGLAGFTTSPGGLDVLARIDILNNPPESLTEVFQRVVGAVHQIRGGDPRLIDAGDPAPAELTKAAQKLASASQVCQLVNIEMSQDRLAIPEKALSANLIAAPIVSDRALAQLLNSQLFIDAGFHQVKIYPDELAPFLAAQRLSDLIQSAEQAHELVQHFTWSAPTGEQGVYRQFLPLMGWLATLNSHCREEILEREPQALAFFGDLRNDDVPLAAAKQALSESIRRLVEQGDRLGRGFFTLTSENFWQAGPDRLVPLLKDLFGRFGTNHWARDALLDIVTAARSDVLRTGVLKEHGNDYGRLLERSDDVRYLVELGLNDDLEGLAAAVKASANCSEGMVATLMRRLGWQHFTPSELAILIDKQFSLGTGGFSISYAIDAGLLDSASDEQLYAFCRALVHRVARLRDGRGHLNRTNGRADDRYVELVLGAVAALVKRSSFKKYRRTALLCLVLQRVVTDGHIGIGDRTAMYEALQANAPVRLDLLTLIVKQSGSDEKKLWMAVFGYKSACSINAADVKALGAPLLTKVFDDAEAARQAQSVKPAPARREKADRVKLGAEAKKQLRGMLDQLRDGSATNGLAWVAGWLLQTNPNSRYGEVQVEVFEREAGSEIAQAVREGLAQIWRKQVPVFKEDTPRSIYNITVAGLQGLHLELGQGENLPHLSDDEVRQAFRYGVFEINGFPKWFWPLAEVHQEVAASELTAVVQESNNGEVSREHAEEILTSLGDAPPPVKRAIAPLAWKFLLSEQGLRDYVVQKLLALTKEVTEVVPQAELENIALAKMQAAFPAAATTAADHSQTLESQRQDSVTWAAAWLTSYPASFQNVVSQWGPENPVGVRQFLFRLAAYFGAERTGALVRLAQESDDGLNALAALYEWTVWAVRPEEDVKHADGESYSVGDRDHAENMRDSLISAIAAAKSQLAYEKLVALRQGTTGAREMYLHKVQFEMREAQYARPPLQQQKYDDFEHDFRASVDGAMSFAMAVQNDLLAVKYDVERGEHSLRRFFSELVFKRSTNKKDAEKEGLALEMDFQRLLASELHHYAKGRYSVAVEPHTAESKRRDIMCSNASLIASIELKMSMRWTLDKYFEALEKQLVGQYMRHRRATIGFLVIVLQEKGRKWKDPATGKRIDFEQLLAALREKALELEAKDRRQYLRIVGIDATPPDSFRNAKKTAPGRTITAGGRSPARRPMTRVTKALNAAPKAFKTAAKKMPKAKRRGPAVLIPRKK
jgi:hypothetical protein